jgi:glutamate-1-semialdehyde 2,1-aminomutase
MAAAVATLRVLRETHAIAHMREMGEALRTGLDRLAARHGLPIRQTGPAQMPMVLFDNDPDFAKANAFCAAALRHGAYFHPKHNMFLSAAHTVPDIEQILNAADRALGEVARQSVPAA